MMRDRELGRDGDGEPGELRALLRQWTVPTTPLELEQGLRRAFRRRRAKKKRELVWLSLAAGLALVLVYLAAAPRRSAPRVVAERAPLVPTPTEPRRAEAMVPARRRPPTRPALPMRPAKTEVLVEPDQAALLTQFARELQGMHQAFPGASAPRIILMPADVPPGPIREAQAADHVLPHRTRWEKASTQWPVVQRSL